MNEKLENKKSKICFVSLNSYHPLIEKKLSYMGGAEIQQVQLAKELKKRGYEISFITYGEKNEGAQCENIYGFNILTVYSKYHVNNLSFFYKAFRIWRKMKEVDADIYYHHSGSTGVTGLFCRLNKKNGIIHISSDAYVTGENIISKNIIVNLLNKIGNWFDIKLSNRVISQNNFQKKILKEKFKVNSIIIKNFLDISSPFNKRSIGDYLLWIGTIRSVKQPELFLNIAQHFPEYKFVMIGGEGESSELFEKIKNAAKNIQNVEFKDFVPPQEIYTYYQKAILLISTSRIEGFPNIFLEAWSCSIPVVSLNVDPDGIISKYRLGYHSKTFDHMLDNIKKLLKDKELLETMGKNGRKYVEENHDIRKIVDQYENLIENLVKNTDKNLLRKFNI
jgi:glycosyltransferase involved in cell wall biosynthesis